MTGSVVRIEIPIADHNPDRAAALVERELRRWIEHRLKRGRLGRHAVGTPRIVSENVPTRANEWKSRPRPHRVLSRVAQHAFPMMA